MPEHSADDSYITETQSSDEPQFYMYTAIDYSASCGAEQVRKNIDGLACPIGKWTELSMEMDITQDMLDQSNKTIEAISNVVESGDKNIITFYVDDWSITKIQNN